MWKPYDRILRKMIFAFVIVLGGSVRPVHAVVTLEDFCRTSAGRTIVFVDMTTRFAEGDDQILQAGIERIIKRARPGSRVTVLTITDSFSRMDMPFDQCVPKCDPSDGSCSPLQAQRVVPEFNDILDRAVPGMVAKKSLSASDIALTMAYALRMRAPDEPLSIYVFSDMLERSRALDLRALARRAVQKPKQSGALRREGLSLLQKVGFDVDLAGLRIVVFGFGREDGERRPLDPEMVEFVRRFWTEAFRASNATGVEFHGRLP